jgi:hypothetical protein
LVAGFSVVFFGVWSAYPLIFVHLTIDSEALLVRPWPLHIRARRVAWSDMAAWRQPPKRHDLIIECIDGRTLTIKLSRMLPGSRSRILALIGNRVQHKLDK